MVREAGMIRRHPLLGGALVLLAACGGGEPQEPTPTTASVAHIAITPDPPRLGVGTSAQFTAVATDSAGAVLSGRAITWATSDTGIATVSPAGLVNAAQKGSVTITASSEGIQGSVQVTTAYLFSQISAGAYYTCAVTTASDGFCWGSAKRGQLGIGTIADSALVPTRVAGGLKFASIHTTSVIGGHTCALTTTGAAACWGSGESGQLGNGAFAASSSPVPVTGLPELARVAVGGAHSCALAKGSGAAWCWGFNGDGELGTGDTLGSGVPVAVGGRLAFRDISLGPAHTCGITTGGALYCWGELDPDHMFPPDTGRTRVPRLVSATLSFREVTEGWFHGCALTGEGAAYCWGDNQEGQLGTGDIAGGLTPLPVAGSVTFTSLSAGAFHTCGMGTSASTYCWGDNTYNQIGHPLGVSCEGTPSRCLMPEAVPSPPAFVAVSAGRAHTCALAADGDAYCWGANFLGELGNGTQDPSSLPVLVTSP
jgi:alpha-tubulin suppressor-like RCC1 family protein